MTSPILEFQGKYRFLSNFHPAIFPWEGRIWPTSEHAYQASKTLDKVIRGRICVLPSPQDAKRVGSNLKLRVDWEEVKLDMMRAVVFAKFKHNARLAAELLNTGDAELVEGNRRGDLFWGRTLGPSGEGHNHLGIILMEVRERLRK